MGAKAIDYSVYNEEALFMELNSTKEQIAELESKKTHSHLRRTGQGQHGEI